MPTDREGFARPEWIQARIFEGMLALLRELAERATVVLILEDLHWADGSTRDLVAFLARNVRAERLVVVGTFRTDELHRRHPLRPWLAEMDRLPRVRRIDLSRFGRTELGEQMTAILGSAPEPELVVAIEARAEGNPFFVEELLAARGDAGGAGVPETLREVLLSRVASLSEDAQRVLGIASMDGRSVEPGLLAEVAAQPEAELEDPLREALAAQLLVNDPSGDGRVTASAMRSSPRRSTTTCCRRSAAGSTRPTRRRWMLGRYRTVPRAPVSWRRSPITRLRRTNPFAPCGHGSWPRARHLRRGLRRGPAGVRARHRSLGRRAGRRPTERRRPRPPPPRGELRGHDRWLAGARGGAARMAVRLLDLDRDPERWAAANERLSRALWMVGDPVERPRSSRRRPSRWDAPGHRPSERASWLRWRRPTCSRATTLAPSRRPRRPSRSRGGRCPGLRAHAMSTLGTSKALLGRATRDCRCRARRSPQPGRWRRPRCRSGYANLSAVLLVCGELRRALRWPTPG